MKKRIYKILSVFLIFGFLNELFFPTAALALTGGPSQPEVQGFTPVGTSDMVDIFSGDFNYNIPLLDVGGYPINLSYNSGITMDQEASWVGLGWNINPGVIVRNMRSVPDDWNGDIIRKEFNIKENITYGGTVYPDGELFGVNLTKLGDLGFGLGLSYNNYNGFGFSMSLSPTLWSTESNKGTMTASLGLSAGSESGVGVSPSLSFSKGVDDKSNRDRRVTGKIGVPFNSRAGLQALTISTSVDQTLGNGDNDKSWNKDAKAYTGKRRTTPSNGSSSISFASPAYSPQAGNPMINISLSVSATLGGEFFGTHPEGRLEGFYSSQSLLNKQQDLPAYGYMNVQNGASLDEVLLDFNREKDGSFSENTPNLPLTNFTYDVFSVSGQGIGGMYRPFRGDVGVVFDSKVNSISGGADFGGIEIGAGVAAHPGVNFSLNESDSKTGKWEDNNTAASLLRFKSTTSDPAYEPYYFKQAGEKTAESDQLFFRNIGEFDPIRVELNKDVEDVTAKGSYNKSGTNMAQNTRTQRARRNEVISALNADETAIFGEVKKIENYPINNFSLCSGCTSGAYAGYHNRYQPSLLPRTDGNHRGHHISQITSYRADGAKYVYGIPAYNITQEEVSFAIEGGNPDCSSGLVTYTSGTDDSKGNSNGIDNYFDKTTLPAFAHSYLLTEVLSADYVDIKGDGPTDDDLGTYTKINYTRVSDTYKWRVPYGDANPSDGITPLANFNEGFKSQSGDKGDDKANYIYGEKEVWYIHSIETKNFIAEFTLTDREDGFGVVGKQGGRSTTGPLKKLKKIELYSRQDKMHTTTPIPIKTVNFEYDYSLCPNVPNNSENPIDLEGNTVVSTDPDNVNAGKGKLTLKKVYFTYGNSKKGRLSPYRFNYADLDHNGTVTGDENPSYSMKGYDRWGNFKPNPGGSSCNPTSTTAPSSEFPYVEQNSLANTYAAAWSLSSINLPSGGEIKVWFESDDYAYVQNKRAMQMFKICGAGSNTAPGLSALTDGTSNTLYSSITNRNLYLYFELQNPVSTANLATAKNTIGNSYFREKDGTLIKNLYFKFLINLERSGEAYEYVPGYVEINNDVNDNYGVVDFGNGQSSYGWVKLKEVEIADKVSLELMVNPISQAAWNFTKLYLPRIAYNQSDPGSTAVLQILKSIVSTFDQIKNTVQGFNKSLLTAGCSKEFIPQKSFIRLYNPVNAKKGGGSRVKKITLADKWSSMTNVSSYVDASYGQEYDYTTTDEYGNTISSGVAAYEPTLGGDENPFRQPVFFNVEKLLVANDDYFQEEPYGESFFPGASVGYSKVTVKNLPHTGVTRNATGKVVHEFYTARDFPTITSRTALDPVRKKPRPLLKLLKIKNKDYMTASQGFVVETNDMHGKPKAQWVYQEDKADPISGVEYKYKKGQRSISLPLVDQTISVTGLNNNVLAVDKTGAVSERMVGVDYDFVVDMREQKTVSRCGGLGGNLDAFVVLVAPVAIPTALPTYAQEKIRFRSVVTTKVINRYGILEETIAHDLGSTVSTKNKLFDAETGEVLLTETVNQFDDPVFALTYPAHWGYDRMGPAYKNIGISTTGSSGYLVPGDEIAANGNKLWVKSISPLSVVDRQGNQVNISGITVKVLRSGRRNQQNTPIGNITSLKSPISGNAISVGQSIEIINASAVEFTELAGLFCECDNVPGTIYNPYIKGTLGNWRPLRSHLCLSGRTQTLVNDNTKVRNDGIFSVFNPFWTAAGGSDWNKNSSSWQFTSEVTTYSALGPELENKDALGRYSSAMYGYNNTLPTAVSSNTQYREIAFDGFEDYDFDDCEKDHFSFELDYSANVVKDKSHTGRRSIKVAAGQTVSYSNTMLDCVDSNTPPNGGNCCDVNIGIGTEANTYTANPIGGLAPFTYVWTVNSDAIIIGTSTANEVEIEVTDAAPTLTLTITDSNGCTSTKTISL